MCGIYTLYTSKNFDLNQISKIKTGLKRRGPDYFGYKFELNKNLFLAHSRLSIQDLSEAASQPMQLENKKYTILFNGEVYNNFELRKTYLKNEDFLTNSDTE